jgi:hypothetical protein
MDNLKRGNLNIIKLEYGCIIMKNYIKMILKIILMKDNSFIKEKENIYMMKIIITEKI